MIYKQKIKYLFLILFLIYFIKNIFYLQNFAKNATSSMTENEIDEKNDNNIIGTEYEIGTVIDGDEKMKWIVIDYDKKNPSRVLLMSKNIIDYREYHNPYEKSNYKNSKIRYYLNKEFYEKNFTEDEKRRITIQSVPVTIELGQSTFENKETITIADKIFLFSNDEINKIDDKYKNFEPNSYAKKIFDYKETVGIWTRDIVNYDKAKVMLEKEVKESELYVVRGVVVGMWYDLSMTPTYDFLDDFFYKLEEGFDDIHKLDRKGGKLRYIQFTEDEKNNAVRFYEKEKENFKQVNFGTYYKNTTQKIPWLIVDADDNSITLLSKYIIEYMELEYDTYDKEILKNNPYEHSNIKKYLNEILYEKCFTDEEKDLFVTVSNEKMKIPDVNDVFNYRLLNYDYGSDIYQVSIDMVSKNFFDYRHKYSFFINEPYEYNDNIYLMSFVEKLGANIITFNYSNKTTDIITASGLRPIIKVDKEKFLEYLNEQAIYINLDNLYENNYINKNLYYGRKIKFGKYEQDGILSNGKDDIWWTIVKKYKDKYLLLANKVLDVIDLTNDIHIDDFSKSYAYYYANSIFFDNAFNDEEKNAILIVNNIMYGIMMNLRIN